MGLSLRKRLQRYLESRNCWVPKEEIIQVAKTAYEAERRGLSSEYVGRMLRQMAVEGKIQADYYKGKKGQDLVKYSALNVEKEIIVKVKFGIIELENGKTIAKPIN